MENESWKVKSFDEIQTAKLYDIIKLRVDVFVVEQNSPYSDLDNYDQKALHIWLEYKGEIVAYCRVFPPNIKYTEASIGRVVCQPKYRGENWGRKLMLKAIATVENEFETTAIRISAQDYLLNFYQSLGFSPTDKKYLEDGLPHTEMVKK